MNNAQRQFALDTLAHKASKAFGCTYQQALAVLTDYPDEDLERLMLSPLGLAKVFVGRKF